MADDLIPIRLVPRTASGRSRFEPLTRQLDRPSDFLVESPVAAEVERQAAAYRFHGVRTSPFGRIDGLVAPQLAAELFAVDLAGMGTAFQRPDPKRTLVVPDELAANVEYAYVPTPFEYFSESRISPPASRHHLRLDDVAREVNALHCHRNGWTGRGVRVAMADTGFARHPHHESGGYAMDRYALREGDVAEQDLSGHGTACSANVLAIAPDCRLVCMKNTITRDQAALTLEKCLETNPAVMVQSWGWPWDDAPFGEADQRLLEMNDIQSIIAAEATRTVVLFSAGNDGKRCFPAALPNVIAVGGVTIEEDGTLSASNAASSFESRLFPGRNVPDVCGVVGHASASAEARRGHIMLPVPRDSGFDGTDLPAKKGWGLFSGTSSAAPQVAGVAALMLGANPDLTPARVTEILRATARDVAAGTSATGDAASAGTDLATGAGLVDAFAACQAALVA